MKTLPLWVVATIGREVILKAKFEGPCKTYRAGSVGRLDALQAAADGSLYAVVALEVEDPGDLEEFEFEDLMPASREQIKISVDFETGAIAF